MKKQKEVGGYAPYSQHTNSYIFISSFALAVGGVLLGITIPGNNFHILFEAALVLILFGAARTAYSLATPEKSTYDDPTTTNSFRI